MLPWTTCQVIDSPSSCRAFCARRIIITHDKGLLGDAGDYLCDDRPYKANCEKFQGQLLAFVDGFHWPQALAILGKASTSLTLGITGGPGTRVEKISNYLESIKEQEK